MSEDLQDIGAEVNGMLGQAPESGVAPDLTLQREERCKPVVLAILQKMLDQNLVFGDEAYVEQVLIGYLEKILKVMVVEIEQSIMASLVQSLRYSFETGIAVKLGKPVTEMTLQELDAILSSQK